MILNNRIVSEFVKATKDDTKQNITEKVVYGTITSYDENTKTCYVRLDGSDKETPITQFTSTVNKDERVTVMIKNHTAVITGNLKTPSVGIKQVGQAVEDKFDSTMRPIDLLFIRSLFEDNK